MADLKLVLIEARDDLTTKDAEIERLKKQLQRKAELIEHGGFSYDKGKDGKPKGDPYCPVCLAKDELLIRLTRPPHGTTSSRCPNPSCNMKIGPCAQIDRRKQKKWLLRRANM